MMPLPDPTTTQYSSTTTSTAIWPNQENWKKNAVPPPVEEFKQLSAGNYHNCGLRPNGTVLCWGNDLFGEVSDTPGENFSYVDAGGTRSCGILESDRTIRCWGMQHMVRNEKKAKYYKAYHSVTVGQYHVCGLEEYSRSAVCWGMDNHGQAQPPRGVAFIDLCAGGDHTCGIRWDDHSAMCWGSDEFKVLTHTPPTGYRFKSIVCGLEHTCGEFEDGGVHCWGGEPTGDLRKNPNYIIDLPGKSGKSILIKLQPAVSSNRLEKTSSAFNLRFGENFMNIKNLPLKPISMPLTANFIKSFKNLSKWLAPETKTGKSRGGVNKAALKTQWNGGFMAM